MTTDEQRIPIEDLLTLYEQTDQECGGTISGADFLDAVANWIERHGLHSLQTKARKALEDDGTLQHPSTP